MKLKSKLLTLCLSALLLISMCVVSFAADGTTELLRWTFDSAPQGASGAAGVVADGVLSLAKGASGIYRMPFGDTLAKGNYYELNFDVKADEDRGGIGTRFYDYSDIYMNYGTFSPGYGFCFRRATANGSQISAAEIDVEATELNHWYTVKVEWNTASDKLYTRYTVVDTASGKVLGSVEYDQFPDWYGKLSTPKAEPKCLHIDTVIANTQVDNVVLYQHAQKPGAPEVTPGGSGGNTPGETPASPDIIANETFDGETALNKNWAPHGSYTVANDVMTFGDNVSSWPTLKFKGVNTTDVYELSYDIKATEDVHKTTGLDRFLMYGVNNSQSFGAYLPGEGFGFSNLAFQCAIPATAIDIWYTVKCEWSMNPENTYATYSVCVTDTGAPLGEHTSQKIWTNAAGVPMSNFVAPTSVYVWNDSLTGCQIDNIVIRKVNGESSAEAPSPRITADNVPLLDVNNINNSSILSASITSDAENGLLVLAAYIGDELSGVASTSTNSDSVYSLTAEGKDGFTGADSVKAFFFDGSTTDFKPLGKVTEVSKNKSLTASASFSSATPVLSNIQVAKVTSGKVANVVNAGGRNGWKVTAESDLDANIAVKLSDSFVCGLDTAQTAHVEIDYYDEGLGGFSLFYMGTDGEYKSKYVQLHGTNTWKVASFDLYDASFKNDCYTNDFIIMTNDVTYTSPKKYYMHTSYYDVIFGGFRVELDDETASPFDIAIDTEKVGNVFFSSEDDGDLVFNASYTDPAGILTSGTATYTVKDYEGNIVLEETQSFVDNADVFTIEKGGIPFGIYTLEVALSGDNVEQSEVYDFSYALRAPESNMHFGTNVHFDWHEAFTTDDVDAQLELIKASGYGFVRTKTEWMDIDPDGDGNFRPHEIYWYGNKKADELGLEILAIIGQGHPAYDYFPYFLDSEELRAKYAEACAYIVSELKEYTDYYTNPNEMNAFYPDDWDFATQGTNAKYYAAYSKAANEAIYAEHPDAKIITGAICQTGIDWAEEIYQLGLLDYAEGCSFHWYDYRQGPETTAKNYFTQARAITDKYSDTDETWVTENGWPTLNYDDIAVAYGRATEYEQAKWYARSFSVFSDPAIADKYFHYCFPNTNVGYFWQEDNFGIVRSHDYKTPYAAKPAYIATTAFHTIVGDATFYGDQNTTDGKYYDYKFVNDAGETIMVLWREESVANKTYTFSTDKAKVEIYDMYGNKTVQNVTGGSVSLTMTDAPIYVKAID